MIRRRQDEGRVDVEAGPPEHEVERIRLASTLHEERRLHARTVIRLERTIEAQKAKLAEAQARLAEEGR